MHQEQQIRLPLPPDGLEEEPRYVNAKQYLRIVKMREKRRRLPPRPKLPKKYKHESRHKHALRRARCGNGRFVSRKDTDTAKLPTRSKAGHEEDCDSEGKDNSEDNNGLAEILQSKYSLHT